MRSNAKLVIASETIKYLFEKAGCARKIRFAIMLGDLGLIIEVEKYARYTLLHYCYWRNIMAANMLLSNCFT